MIIRIQLQLFASDSVQALQSHVNFVRFSSFVLVSSHAHLPENQINKIDSGANHDRRPFSELFSIFSCCFFQFHVFSCCFFSIS